MLGLIHSHPGLHAAFGLQVGHSWIINIIINNNLSPCEILWNCYILKVTHIHKSSDVSFGLCFSGSLISSNQRMKYPLEVYFKWWRRFEQRVFNFLKDFIYLFLERGREGERERNINVWLPLTCPPPRTWPTTQACALDWESNRRTFSSQASTQSNEPHQPGLEQMVFKQLG